MSEQIKKSDPTIEYECEHDRHTGPVVIAKYEIESECVDYSFLCEPCCKGIYPQYFVKDNSPEIDQLKALLKKAESVIDFYANKDTWRASASNNLLKLNPSCDDGEVTPLDAMEDYYRYRGGKLARQYFKDKPPIICPS